MEVLKRKAEYTVIKKRSGRFGVLNKKNKWIGGDEKVKILVKEKLLKVPAPKPKEEPAKEEAAPETTDAATEEAKA